MMTAEMIIDFLIMWVILVLSGTVHEYSHSTAAYLKGDNTATYMGRRTLNPIKHIDFFGTILVPFVIGMTTGFAFFAWMKPVPVNHNNFQNPKKDRAIVTFAGPLSNFLIMMIAFLCLTLFFPELTSSEFTNVAEISSAKMIVAEILTYFAIINAILGIFNLIPIPPLDGSWILAAFVPDKYKSQLRIFFMIGPFILIALLLFNGLTWAFKFVISPLFLGFFMGNGVIVPIIGILAIAITGYFLIFRNSNKVVIDKPVFKTKNKNVFIKTVDKENTVSIENTNQALYEKVKDHIYNYEQGLEIDSSKLKQDIDMLKSRLIKEGNICPEQDFSADQDLVCKECEFYPNCLLRKLEEISMAKINRNTDK